MKRNYKFLMFLFTVFVYGNILAQEEQDFTPPSIDDEKEIPVIKEKLPVPEDGQDYTIRYFSGVTDGEESRIAVKNLGYILRKATVFVYTQDGRKIDVKIVKKGWDDVKREGSTKNGEFKSVFRTALEFGVIISAVEKGIPFIVAISAGTEIFPTSNLFVDINTKQAATYAANDQSPVNTENTFSSNNLTYIIIGLAIIIIGLLIAILFRKNRSTVGLFFLLLSIFSVKAGEVTPLGNTLDNSSQNSQNQKLVDESRKKIREALDDEYDKEKKDEADLLSEEDAEFEPELDPSGQPSLPSSCIATANSSESGSMDGEQDRTEKDGPQNDKYKGGDNNENSLSEDEIDYESRNSNTSDQPQNSGGTEMISSTNYEAKESNNENPFTGDSSSETYRRLPKYDEDGNLKNSGDYPDAPSKYDPNWVPDEDVFIESDGSSGIYRRLPKYDEDGYLKNPGDFPDAPTNYDPDWEPAENPFTGETSSGSYSRLPKYDENGNLKNPGDYPEAPPKYDPDWVPEENVFVETNGTTGTYTRMPKYDKDGNLLSYGDYPQAPKQIDPDRVNDQEYIMNEIEANIDDKGQPKDGEDSNSDRAAQNELPEPGQKDPSEMNGEKKHTSNSSNDRKSEGCECLKKAYKELHKRRYSLEKLSKIGKYNKKVTDFGLSFGDNFSSASGAGSLAWKNKRIKIMKSMKKFDKSYKDKHKQIIDLLHKNLMAIAKCERMLGEDDWYNKYGFIYYEFMKTRYATYK